MFDIAKDNTEISLYICILHSIRLPPPKCCSTLSKDPFANSCPERLDIPLSRQEQTTERYDLSWSKVHCRRIRSPDDGDAVHLRVSRCDYTGGRVRAVGSRVRTYTGSLEALEAHKCVAPPIAVLPNTWSNRVTLARTIFIGVSTPCDHSGIVNRFSTYFAGNGSGRSTVLLHVHCCCIDFSTCSSSVLGLCLSAVSPSYLPSLTSSIISREQLVRESCAGTDHRLSSCSSCESPMVT